MSKVIIDESSLPPINIKGDPIRLLRFRLISTTKNVRSQWSTIFPLIPPDYQWITVSTSNSKETPVNISFNGVTGVVSWGTNSFYGLVSDSGVTINKTSVDLVSHSLRVGDYVIVRDPAGVIDYAVFSAKRDGIYKVTDVVSSSKIKIDLSPATALVNGTPLTVEAVAPSSQYDLYLQYSNSGSGLPISGYSWTYYGTFASTGSLAVPTEKIPGSADTIEIVLQRPTNPKKRYNINDEHAITKCPIVVAKAEIQFRSVVTR